MQLKQPTTKKLPEKQFRRIKVNGEPIQRLFPDEEFYAVPGFPTFYVSKYARVIKWNPKIGKPQLRRGTLNKKTGYVGIELSNGRKSRAFTTISKVVAMVWLKKPDWVPDTYGLQKLQWWKKLNAHHLEKVRNNIENRPIYMDWAENLRLVYGKYHKKVDSIEAFKYRVSDKSYRKAKYLDEIADYFGCSEQVVLEMLMHKPTERKKKWDYYTDGNGIDFAVKRYKK